MSGQLNRRRGAVIGICLSLVFGFLPARTVYAIEGGESAIGENVITMISRNSSGQIYQQCSGTVIAPRLVVTAKHCFPMYNSEHVLGSLTEIVFPGSDLNNVFETAKISKVITTPGIYVVNSDDLAIVITATNLPVVGNIRLATSEDIDRFRITNPTVVTYGYGSNALIQGMQKAPLKIVNKFVSNYNNLTNESFTIEYISPTSYICGGDSGGPSFVIENGFMVYVGPTSSATREGCASGIVGTFRLNGTALAYRTELLETAKQAVLDLQQLEESKMKEDAEKAAKEKEDAENAAKQQLPKKKKVVTCVRGASQKRVVGVNAKCPVGYKKK